MHTIQVVSMCYQYCGLVCSVAIRCHRKENSTMMEIKKEWMAWQQNHIHGIFFNGKEVFSHTGKRVVWLAWRRMLGGSR